MKCRACFWTAVALCVAALSLAVAGYANGRYGGEKPGTINDVPTERRQDLSTIRWAIHTADAWDVRDHRLCAEEVDLKVRTPGEVNWGHLGELQMETLSYTRCMVKYTNLRLLYMLRQNCVGLNASVCKMETTP